MTGRRHMLRRSWESRRLPTAGAPERGALRSPRKTPGQRLRRELFERVLRDVESEGVAGLGDSATARARVERLIDEGIRDMAVRSLSPRERGALESAVHAELNGFGPVQPLMHDPTVSDILVNGPEEVWVDRFGRVERTRYAFDDDEHLLRVVGRLVSAQGRHLDEATPYVDVRLPDGSRLHASIPPVSRAPVLAIRRARAIPFDMDQLCDCQTLTRPMVRLLEAAVRGARSILISGGAASGKTTLLNVLAGCIPEHERVVTIEETAELRLAHPHVVALEGRQPNVEGLGGVGLRTLVRNALRLRADRIIVGEVRGDEVFDMLQAMNIGHEGSLTTVHANSPQDALRRVETLVLMGGVELPSRAIRELLGAAFDLVVHLKRFGDGTRRIVSISEVLPETNGELTARALFALAATGDASGNAGAIATGHVPTFIDALRQVDPGIDTILQAPDAAAESASGGGTGA